MDADKKEILPEIEVKANELAFFGKIAAGVTHELKNVLAIIKESNGLMADLLAMLKETPFVYREKFQRSIGRIEEQVRRGTEITSRFNGFAHGVDHPLASVDLNVIVAQTVLLAARFARLQNVELKGAVCDHPVMLIVNPFRVQMALTMAIEVFTGCMGGGGSILLQVREDLDPSGLDFYFDGGLGEKVIKEAVTEFSQWREFQELASMQDMRCEWLMPGGGFSLFFAGTLSPKQTPSSK
jgi:hypothetical protein